MNKSIISSILGGLILGMIVQLNHVSTTVDTIVQHHYKRFIKLANDCKIPVNESEARVEMDYKNPNKPYYAITSYFDNIITINYRKYMKLTEIEQEQVMLHELGHLLLDLNHDDEDLNLMNTYGFIDKQDYKTNYNSYVRKLFKDCKKPIPEIFKHE